MTLTEQLETGEPIEISEKVFNHHFTILPPINICQEVTLPNGKKQHTAFCYAESWGTIIAFWCLNNKYYCCDTQVFHTRG